ncbi:ATP-binding cassette domain-containing protein [Clostridium sp. LY3-2]|uniref:ribosomal protection-like ABC-F family protein n=1 Tax=Clostridium sp. LY3-2 TaxID=2942482 RepID=UPI00215209A2|nr:ABC-F family ATP-binding cassette domain-containing protein [Clostridium sp. LY3-2]MCR6514005.1 ATP-binding cassette domain-containing protein [Clostridium sp. LY3-2]
MELINIDKLKKYYKDRLVLDIEKFSMFEEEKIGLVGENGAGKTTLLKILIGEVEKDFGKVFLTDSYSYITQDENFNDLNKNLSGGEKVKLRTREALRDKKKLIIADEPTANLDRKSIESLERRFKEFKGAILLVSHDREFLNSVCTKIIEINSSKLKVYDGNYNTYLRLKDEENKNKERKYDSFIKEKNRLEKVKIKKAEKSDRIRKTPKRMGNSEARLHKMGGQRGKKNLDQNAKAIQSRIEKLEKVEKPKEDKEIKINIREGLEIISKNLIDINNLNIEFKDKVILKDASFKIKKSKKIALLGENGEGKTTLIKEILKGRNQNIKVNPKVKIGYFDQDRKILKEDKTILENIKETSSFDETFIRINLSLFGFRRDDIIKPIKVLSGGEKVKVALLKIILEDNNFLVLDEPTNYLDIKTLSALEKALKSSNKTMLIVSHDRTFINNLCDYFLEIKDKKIISFNGNLEEFLESKNKKPKEDIKLKEKIMLLENNISKTISFISVEKDINKKIQYEREYEALLKELKKLKM